MPGFWPCSQEPKPCFLCRPRSPRPVSPCLCPSPAASANLTPPPGSAAHCPRLGPAGLLPTMWSACPEGSLKLIPSSPFILLPFPSRGSPFSNAVVLKVWSPDRQLQQHPGGLQILHTCCMRDSGGFNKLPGDSEALRIRNHSAQHILPLASRAFFLKPRPRPHILSLSNSS